MCIGKLIDSEDRKSYIDEIMNIQQSLKRLLSTGLTQRSVALELGCTQAHVSDMVNGKTGAKRPSAKIVAGIERLERLRKVFAVSHNEKLVAGLGVEHPNLFSQESSSKPPALVVPDIPPDLQTAAVMLKGLSGKFADEDAIAWFLQLPPKNRAEIFEIHDCITTGLCIEELNRIKSVTNGDPKNDFGYPYSVIEIQ